MPLQPPRQLVGRLVGLAALTLVHYMRRLTKRRTAMVAIAVLAGVSLLVANMPVDVASHEEASQRQRGVSEQQQQPELGAPCVDFQSILNDMSQRNSPLASKLFWQGDPEQIEKRAATMPRCVWYPSPLTDGRPQCCCSDRTQDGRFVRCLPTFVVIGAQKSGSTALFAYSILHAQVLRPKKKEAHLFDRLPYTADEVGRRKPILATISSYLSMFPSLPSDRAHRYITTETTPSYISSFGAPFFMSALLPTTKYVVILRDPVSRAYSEYQMKLRRVESQPDVNDPTTVEAFRKLISECYVSNNDVKSALLINHQSPKRPRDAELAPDVTCLRSVLQGQQLFPGFFNHRKRYSQVARCLDDGRHLNEANIIKCFGQSVVSYESVESLEAAFQSDMDKCFECTDDSYNLRWGTDDCWPSGVTSDIRRNFLVRGIYLPQIRRWTSMVGRDRLLILSDRDLKDRPTETMQRVFKHVGLQPGNYSATQADAEAVLDKYYPSFERTGWRMHSEYEPMTAAMEAKLRAFYAPYNRQLFQALGRDFGWNDNVDVGT